MAPDRGTTFQHGGYGTRILSKLMRVLGVGVFSMAEEERNTPLNSNIPPLNLARSPLVDKDFMLDRFRPMDSADDGGGGRKLAIVPKGGNDKDVGLTKNVSWGFPASTAESKTRLRKKTKLLQLWHHFQKKSASSFFKKATSIPRGN